MIGVRRRPDFVSQLRPRFIVPAERAQKGRIDGPDAIELRLLFQDLYFSDDLTTGRRRSELQALVDADLEARKARNEMKEREANKPPPLIGEGEEGE